MRNIVLVAIVLALAVAAISHESGSKSPDSSSSVAGSGESNGFLAAQHKYDKVWGDHATDDELMAVGRTICALRKRGMSDTNILTATVGYHLPAGSKARTLGLQRIRDAKKYLCP